MMASPDYFKIENETVHLYKLQKSWGEGDGLGEEAKQGEASWVSAKTKEVPWRKPGIWGDLEDSDTRIIMASAYRIQRISEDQWIAFYFTSAGIADLKKLTTGNPDEGWWLKEEKENPNAVMTFYSSDDEFLENRPYLEVYYLPPNK